MNVIYNIHSLYFQGKKIPLSQYKGPILALTESEKVEISELEKKVANLILEKSKVGGVYSSKPRHSDTSTHYWESAIYAIDREIEIYKAKILEIKRNRFNIQKMTEKNV